MDIDPRLHRGPPRDDEPDTSESADSDSEYPEPPSQRPPPQTHFSPGANSHSFGHQAHGHGHGYGHNIPHQPAYGAYPAPAPAPGPNPSPPDGTADPNDPSDKRPRACESCRSLKVRCEPDPNPDEPCKRCAKAGRHCVVTAPNRKRQKKTDSRVTELERKIDVLTATLYASQGQGQGQSQSHRVEAVLPSNNAAQAQGHGHGQAYSGSVSSGSRGEENTGSGRRWLVPGQNNSDRSGSLGGIPSRPGPSGLGKRHYSGELKEHSQGRDTMARTISTPSQGSNPSPGTENTDHSGRQWPTPWASWSNNTRKPSPPSAKDPGVPDIIDRGLVSLPVALDAFTRYVECMCHHIPMVVFPPGVQMSEIRKHRPVLFHAIVGVAVGPFEPSVQSTLLLEFYRSVGERVIVRGEKSLDLVQGLLVSCSFYTPPENFEEIKFYQLAQLAVAVAMDIGMYRKTAAKGRPFNPIREFMKQSPVMDPDSPEVRRAWLGCYFVSVQTSSALRRPILLRWLPYMDECVDILENSPNALPTDKRMVQWAKLGRIIEEISSRFFADDMGGPSFSESKFQFTLKAFEKQLEAWKKEALTHPDSQIMTQAQAIVNIYLHENAMVLDTSSDENKLSESDFHNPIAAARISALSSTLSSIHEAIDTICSIPVKELISIPTVALARTAFSIVALIKLYSIVTASDSYIGQVIEPRALHVETYLDKVIAHYTAAGALTGGVTPGKFSTVMTMLLEWFKSRKDQHGERGQKPAPTPAQSSAPVTAGQERNQNLPPGSTPLHLLSEVATGEPSNQQQQQQQYPQQGQNQPYLPSRTGHGFPINQPSPSDTNPNSNTQPNTLPSLPPLPPCVSPSQMPTNLHNQTPNPTNTSAPDSTSSAPANWSYNQQSFYQNTPQQYNSTTNPSPNQPQPTSSSATGYPDFTTPLPNSMPLPMSNMPNMPNGMPLYAQDLGVVGLDDQFWTSMEMGMGLGEINMEGGGFWMPQGGWPF